MANNALIWAYAVPGSVQVKKENNPPGCTKHATRPKQGKIFILKLWLLY
jgi:hypothetical protein